ncbi:putative nitrogen fixation protein NifT [Sessilibacter corallicola]|uniref:putative nitrogen fixation protein NifT n=1 Tax=Sessilibacter corallicola TaxID=2904075 RepID=UPI001E39E772|nr:putative nitrogen fixation protein NifT [Sessilibacter corallicola]MCE2029656.1 putative nitrogen fixation protein NifT [Sessilibacter corallicola]
MPSVMLRKDPEGKLTLYVPKRDLEDEIVSLEFDSDEKWGGELKLADGSSYYLEPIALPKLPMTVRVKRLVEAQ